MLGNGTPGPQSDREWMLLISSKLDQITADLSDLRQTHAAAREEYGALEKRVVSLETSRAVALGVLVPVWTLTLLIVQVVLKWLHLT